MDGKNKKKIDQANESTIEKGQEAWEKAKKIKNIKVTVIKGIVKVVSTAMLVLIGFWIFSFLASAEYLNDSDRNSKATSAKETAIGNEALNTILTMEDGKYKISYDEKTGREAIEAILEDNNMNFEDFNDEEIECLYKCLKAEWATTYPNLGGDVDNKDVDSEYVQGVITIKRGKSGGKEEDIVNLTYKPYEEFSGIKDATALNYFSMKDGNIIVANWSSNETIYTPSDSMPDDIKSQYVNTGEQISITETAINYRSMIGIHTVPFEFLLSLLVNTEDVEFVSELADVALDSKIEITVYDNLTEITTIETEHTNEITTYKKWVDYYITTSSQEITEGGTVGHSTSYNTYENNKEITSTEKKEVDYTLTTKRITKNNSYVVGLTNVSSWLADIKNEYTYLPQYGPEENLGLGEPYRYGPEEQKKEDISTTDSEVVAFKNANQSTSTTVDSYNNSTHTTKKICTITGARKQGTLNGLNELTKNTSQTNEYKYESGAKQTSNIGKKFEEVYDKHPGAQAQLDCVSSWLFELLEDSSSTVDYVSIMKYLLYVCTGEDYGVTELDLSIYDQSEFITIGYGIYEGETPLDAFLLAWEGTKKDANGNFVLHRPTDVTIGYGLYLKYNLDLFQNLGYFKGINQSTWESTLYQNRKQRVINGSDIKFYDYSMENGSLKRGAQIPNEKIEEACQNSRANIRQAVIDQLKEANITLTDNQIDALTIVKYKWGNIGNFTSVYHYYKEGNKDKFLSSFYVSGVHPMQKAYRLDERQYAAWLIFDQGKYIDRSGNEIVVNSNSSATQERRSFLDVAKERHDYIRENNYSYVNGTQVPADASRSRGIDCSAYVSDVIYWYGYYNGDQKLVNTFKGHQKTTTWFMNTTNVKSLGWKVLTATQAQAGDIVVRDGHMEIYAGDGKFYNAGSTEAIRKQYSASGVNYLKSFTYAIRVSSSNTNTNKNETVSNGSYKEVKNGREIANYARNVKFYQGANNKWSDGCLGFSQTYSAAIINNDKSIIDYNKIHLVGNSPQNLKCSFKNITNNNKQTILANIYDQINSGKPCIVQVNGNKAGTSRHYVVVIGYKNSVTSRDTIKDTDLLIIDVYDAQVEEVGTKGSGKRFMITGWDTGRKGSEGYGYQIYVLK